MPRTEPIGREAADVIAHAIVVSASCCLKDLDAGAEAAIEDKEWDEEPIDTIRRHMGVLKDAILAAMPPSPVLTAARRVRDEVNPLLEAIKEYRNEEGDPPFNVCDYHRIDDCISALDALADALPGE